MTRLTWDGVGERFFEHGVDRGVLYVGVLDGVPWNGLTAVNSSPTGGEGQPFFYDGQVYLNHSARERYEATINAFFSPPEFDACDGTSEIIQGFYATQQPRSPFHFTWRSFVGNDVDPELGYRIHLLYNGLAEPSGPSYNTLGDTVALNQLSWKITTTPETVSGNAPSAHFYIDSRDADATALSDLEDVLYGTVSTAPRMPLPAEIITIFTP